MARLAGRAGKPASGPVILLRGSAPSRTMHNEPARSQLRRPTGWGGAPASRRASRWPVRARSKAWLASQRHPPALNWFALDWRARTLLAIASQNYRRKAIILPPRLWRANAVRAHIQLNCQCDRKFSNSYARDLGSLSDHMGETIVPLAGRYRADSGRRQDPGLVARMSARQTR